MTHRKPNQTIKQELKRCGISQLQAALDLGIPRARFNLIANGWESPGAEIRIKISEYLGLPKERLFDEPNSQPKHQAS